MSDQMTPEDMKKVMDVQLAVSHLPMDCCCIAVIQVKTGSPAKMQGMLDCEQLQSLFEAEPFELKENETGLRVEITNPNMCFENPDKDFENIDASRDVESLSYSSTTCGTTEGHFSVNFRRGDIKAGKCIRFSWTAKEGSVPDEITPGQKIPFEATIRLQAISSNMLRSIMQKIVDIEVPCIRTGAPRADDVMYGIRKARTSFLS